MLVRMFAGTSECNDLLWVRVSKDLLGTPKDVFLCSVYISPVYSAVHKRADDSIFDVLEQDIELFSSKGYVILGGDFNSRLGSLQDFNEDDPLDLDLEPEMLTNIDIPRNFSDRNPANGFGKSLTNLCTQSDLRILNGRILGDLSGKYTCYQPNGCSTVDYVIASSTLFHNISMFKVHPLTDFSDHCMVSLNIRSASRSFEHVKVAKSNSRLFPERFVWGPDSTQKFIDALNCPIITQKLKDFSSFSLNSATTKADLDQKVKEFQEILVTAGRMSLQVKHKKKSKQSKRNKRWFDKSCFEARNELRNLRYLLVRNPKNPFIRGSYFRKKKEFNKLIRKRKREHENYLLTQLQNLQDKNPTAFWNLLKKLKNEKSTDQEVIPTDTWVEHFKSIHSRSRLEKQVFDYNFEKEILNKLKVLQKDNTSQGPLDYCVTESEICTAIQALKTKKASGEDMIVNEMLKGGKILLLRPLAKLFNSVLETGTFPQYWSRSYIVPIHKSGRKDDPNNYRGIAISSCLGKLFSSILNKRLSTFMEENEILKPNQTGFRKKYRTADNIFILKTLISKYTQSGKRLFACFVDLSKAFDSVWHHGLLFKLLSKGISGKFFDIMNSLYNQSEACVKTKIGLSETFPIEIGVRQGCVLSPSLFNLYISDLVNDLNTGDLDAPILHSSQVSSLFYADDVVILSSSQRGLQNAINILGLYCSKWKLTVNLKKTKIIIFNRKGEILSNFKFYLLDKDLDVVSSYCYLGVVFTAGCNFSTAMKTLQKKALRAMFSIRTTLGENNPSVSLQCKLFDACIVPILLYGAEVWGNAGLNDNSPLEQAHLKFCKAIIGVRRNASNLATRAELGRFPLRIEAYSRLYSYYSRLTREVPTNSLQYQALLVQQDLHRRKVPCWLSNVSKILEESGYGYLLLNQDYNIPSAQSQVKQRLKDIFLQTFYSELNSNGKKENQGNKLRTYRKFKDTYEREQYLNIHNFSHRRAMAKLRISDHPLQIEVGRYNRTPPSDRICTLCNAKDIENEVHFVLECELYSDIRNSFINALNFDTRAKQLVKDELFVYIMKSSDNIVLQKLCEFIYTCFKKRKETCKL